MLLRSTLKIDLSVGRDGRRIDRAAFTLVELLVVMTIIGILVSLLLPAVQRSREAASRTQCANNLHNLAVAALQHEQQNGFFPSCGWGWGWMGDADLGFGLKQPGGFFYNILPYMDQSSVHDMNAGLPRDSAQKWQQTTLMTTVAVPAMTCPSRRRSARTPMAPNYPNMVNCPNPTDGNGFFHNDYRASGGSVFNQWNWGPPTWNDGLKWTGNGTHSMDSNNGVCFQRSQIRAAQITDGASNTYLVGEKYLNPDDYLTGRDIGDDNPALSGDDYDLVAWADPTLPLLPQQDKPGQATWYCFGSVHYGSCNMAFCDGSIHAISYGISAETHRRLAARNDGQPIDPSQF